MDTVIVAFTVVLPLLVMMLIGLGLRKIAVLDDLFVKKLNGLIFKLFLPALLFINVYKTDIRSVFDVKLILYTMGISMVVFFISFLLVPHFEKDNPTRGVMIQGMVRGNGAYFGLPVIIALIGERYAGLMALVVAFAVFCYNITSVIALETFRNEKINMGRIIKGVVSNPMILATLAGMGFVLGDIHLPMLLEGIIRDLGRVATPLALITLGGSFVFTASAKYVKQLSIVVLIKLVVVPAIALPIAITLGFAHYEIACVFALLSAPTAVASFAVAQQLDGNDELAGQIVVFTSIFSMVTIFLWIIILKPYIF
ncbi:MAG: AEC family transporter [Anaerovorax sp.]